MAKNRVREYATRIILAPTRAPGARALSGDPVLIGALPGVALTDATDTVANRGRCTVETNGSFRLSVRAAAEEAGRAVATGDIIFMREGVLNVDARAGTRFGYALGEVAREQTETIEVKIGYA